MKTLDDLLGDSTDDTTTPQAKAPSPSPSKSAAAAPVVMPAKLEVECVTHGALMRLTYEGTTPAWAIQSLRASDPDTKFRTEFPAGRQFGARDTMKATVTQLFSFQGSMGITGLLPDGKSVTVSVYKDKLDDTIKQIAATGKVTEQRIHTIRAWVEGRENKQWRVPKQRRFGMEYWIGRDGKTPFASAFTAEHPDVPDKPADEEEEDDA